VIERNDLRRELRIIFDQAEQYEELQAEVRDMTADRDKWKALAEDLGIKGTLEYDASRNHLKMTTLIDGALLAQTRSTRVLVQEMLSRAHAAFERELKARDQWR
jgi:hypothetical protein